MAKQSHLVISISIEGFRKPKLVRVVEVDPDESDLNYWEDYYSQTKDGLTREATVINIFTTEDL